MSCGSLISQGLIAAGERTVLVSCCSVGNRLFLYATNQSTTGDENLYGFEINPDGSLTPLPGSPYTTGLFSTGLSCCSSGGNVFVYVANINDSSISGFVINADGSLTSLPGFPLVFGPDPQAPIFLRCCNINGINFLYATFASGSVLGFLINADGSLTQVVDAATGLVPSGLNCCNVAGNNYLYVPNQYGASLSGFIINVDGSLSPLPGFPIPVGVRPIFVACCSFGDNVYLYLTIANEDRLMAFKINADGSLTALAVPSYDVGEAPAAISCCSVGDEKILYVANSNSNNISAFTLQADGSLVQLADSPFSDGLGAAGVTCCTVGDNQFLYVGNSTGGSISIFEIATPPIISPESLPNGVKDEEYFVALTQVSGNEPITWRISAGVLPPGLTLNHTTGEISGIARSNGTFTFTVEATSASQCSGEKEYTLTILFASLSISKSAFPSAFSITDQIITYSYLVTNTGEAVRTIDSLTDNLVGSIPCAGTLNPGESITCMAEYSITKDDMVRGSVTNKVTVTSGSATATTTLTILRKNVITETEVISIDHVYDWVITSDSRRLTIDLNSQD